jgi:uncharacterized MAPEG superfamily protein
MIRALVLPGLVLSAVAAGGCTWRYDPRVEETTSVGTLERAERARTAADRMHPACRDGRTDRGQQPEGCDVVVRRD